MGILEAILEWVAIPSYRRSSHPRDWTRVSCIPGRFSTIWATRESFLYKDKVVLGSLSWPKNSFLSLLQLAMTFLEFFKTPFRAIIFWESSQSNFHPLHLLHTFFMDCASCTSPTESCWEGLWGSNKFGKCHLLLPASWCLWRSLAY